MGGVSGLEGWRWIFVWVRPCPSFSSFYQITNSSTGRCVVVYHGHCWLHVHRRLPRRGKELVEVSHGGGVRSDGRSRRQRQTRCSRHALFTQVLSQPSPGLEGLVLRFKLWPGRSSYLLCHLLPTHCAKRRPWILANRIPHASRSSKISSLEV